jgi:hypothetical protein
MAELTNKKRICGSSWFWQLSTWEEYLPLEPKQAGNRRRSFLSLGDETMKRLATTRAGVNFLAYAKEI